MMSLVFFLFLSMVVFQNFYKCDAHTKLLSNKGIIFGQNKKRAAPKHLPREGMTHHERTAEAPEHWTYDINNLKHERFFIIHVEVYNRRSEEEKRRRVETETQRRENEKKKWEEERETETANMEEEQEEWKEWEMSVEDHVMQEMEKEKWAGSREYRFYFPKEEMLDNFVELLQSAWNKVDAKFQLNKSFRFTIDPETYFLTQKQQGEMYPNVAVTRDEPPLKHQDNREVFDSVDEQFTPISHNIKWLQHRDAFLTSMWKNKQEEATCQNYNKCRVSTQEIIYNSLFKARVNSKDTINTKETIEEVIGSVLDKEEFYLLEFIYNDSYLDDKPDDEAKAVVAKVVTVTSMPEMLKEKFFLPHYYFAQNYKLVQAQYDFFKNKSEIDCPLLPLDIKFHFTSDENIHKRIKLHDPDVIPTHLGYMLFRLSLHYATEEFFYEIVHFLFSIYTQIHIKEVGLRTEKSSPIISTTVTPWTSPRNTPRSSKNKQTKKNLKNQKNENDININPELLKSLMNVEGARRNTLDRSFDMDDHIDVNKPTKMQKGKKRKGKGNYTRVQVVKRRN